MKRKKETPKQRIDSALDYLKLCEQSENELLAWFAIDFSRGNLDVDAFKARANTADANLQTIYDLREILKGGRG